MNTISDTYTSGEAAVLAVKAGIDMILMPDDLAEAVQALTAAAESGDISIERIDESVARILTLKRKHGLI